MTKFKQSIEPQVADHFNQEMRRHGLDYKLEQEKLNTEIDKALDEYKSKSGGAGGNRPDAKLLITYKGKTYPVLIEYKGLKDKLVKRNATNEVDNRNAKGEPNYQNIKNYAVNGAIHYANALLHYTKYTEVIAIGITGHKDTTGEFQYELGVYLVSVDNYGAGQKIGEYTDLSFLKEGKNFESFIKTVQELALAPEDRQRIKEIREAEIEARLTMLNNDIFKTEKNLSESDRVNLVAGSIIANLGAGELEPLEKYQLPSKRLMGERDGDIIMRKIEMFLKERASWDQTWQHHSSLGNHFFSR